MYVMGKDTSDTLGAAQELNAAGEIEKPATGDYKTLLDKLDESRNTLQSDMKGVQETQEENQDAVRDAMQASNMVTATERMEMDAQNVVAEAAEEAREAKDQSVEQAKRDFDAAVEEKTSELSTNMGAELNTALAESKEKTEALEKGFDNLKKYKANFTKNFAAWVRPSGGWGDKISKKPTYNDITHSSAEEVPKSMNINPAEGHAVYKKSSGTLTNPDNISSALTILGDLNKTTSVNPDEMVGDKPVSKYMADAINQHPEKKWAAVQEVWAAGGATTPGNDGNNKVIRCFAGNTWIEVVK
jgi:hypothetical protein